MCFIEKAVLKDFAIFTGKYVLGSLFNRFAGFRTCNFLKNTGDSL